MQKLRHFWQNHTLLSNWLVLAVGFTILLVINARHVGFTPSQWIAVIGATLLLAWLCAWILDWE